MSTKSFVIRSRHENGDGGAPMTTPLDKPLKRELDVDGVKYTLTLSPSGLKIVEKWKRKGHEMAWRDIVTGSVELTEQLRISVEATDSGPSSS